MDDALLVYVKKVISTVFVGATTSNRLMIITVSLQIRFRVIPSSSNDFNQKCRNLVFQILGSQQVSRSDETIDHNYMYVQVAQCKKLYIGLLVCGILNIAVSIQLGHRGRTGCNTKNIHVVFAVYTSSGHGLRRALPGFISPVKLAGALRPSLESHARSISFASAFPSVSYDKMS